MTSSPPQAETDTETERIAEASQADVSAGATADDDEVSQQNSIDPAVPDGPRRQHNSGRHRIRSRALRTVAVLAFVVLPLLTFGFAGVAGYFKWRDSTANAAHVASIESVDAARDATIAMLSYTPDNAEQTLTAARNLLTGALRDNYTQLITDVVVPGARQKRITALAAVPAVATVSATADQAVVLVFVNQSASVGNDPPTDSASTVKVTLQRIDGKWLVSAFEPI